MYLISNWAVAPINILSIRELSPHLGLTSIQATIGFNYRDRGIVSAGLQKENRKDRRGRIGCKYDTWYIMHPVEKRQRSHSDRDAKEGGFSKWRGLHEAVTGGARDIGVKGE